MTQVLNFVRTNPYNQSDFYNWGRTLDINNYSYTNYIELSCDLSKREGIINIVINNGINKQQKLQTNPEVYIPISNFKYNLFDSHYSNIILLK
jgi:hypothetical protein